MREQNETTLSKVLLNEKDCQNCPKMVIEYQPALMEESAEDQVLEKQETKTYIFFNLRGNILILKEWRLICLMEPYTREKSVK